MFYDSKHMQKFKELIKESIFPKIMVKQVFCFLPSNKPEVFSFHFTRIINNKEGAKTKSFEVAEFSLLFIKIVRSLIHPDWSGIPNINMMIL